MTRFFRFDITDESYKSLVVACNIAFSYDEKATTWHWRIDKVPANEDWSTHVYDAKVERITLFRFPLESSHPLPAPLSYKGAANMLWAFLQNTEYGPEPDHDGFNRRGWRLFNEGPTPEDKGRTILAYEPRWMLFGK